MGVPPNGLFIMESLIKTDDLEVPPFQETSIFTDQLQVRPYCKVSRGGDWM